MKMAFPIDVVYKWVDGNDVKWQKQKKYWFEKEFNKKNTYRGAGAKERFRDNNELMYSLRSVAENAPWVNHIYIVTGFNQIPKWLNTKHPKITIVPHDVIFPKDVLPVFSSTSIDMCLSNIPGLSEHFLIADDDTIFNKKIKPSFFYDKHGRARVLYNKHRDYNRDIDKWKSSVDEFTKTLINAAVLVKKACGKTFYIGRPSHGIDPYIKSSMIECRNNEKIKPVLDNLIKLKFRSEKCVSRWIFNIYDYVNNRATMHHCHPYKSNHITDFIYNTLHFYGVRHSPLFCEDAKVSKKSVKHSVIVCINDSNKSGKDVLEHNASFLKNRFPNKSEFEL